VVYQTIIREKLITKLDHAAYLGKELEKAAIALNLGRSYVQDEPLF
jgi:dihydropteroate synthase